MRSMAIQVQAGDSLWAIAQRELGDGNRWREIQAANNLTGTTIRPGQSLTLPGQPAAAAPPEAAIGTPASTTATPATKNPNATLLQDPAYSAFLRRQGFDESEIQSTLAANKEALGRRILQAQPGRQIRREDAQRGINQDFENRGLLRSSSRLAAQARADQKLDLEKTQFETGIREEQAGLEREAASRLAAGRRRQVEEGEAARYRISQRNIGASV